MLNIIHKGYRTILQLFYNDKSQFFHLREIVRRTGLNENSVYRFLNKLEEEKILKVQKEGNLKKYGVKHNQQVYTAFSCFDVDKFNNLPHLRKTAISSYLNALPQQPIFAILFGSTAKENYRKDSDLDILIISNEKIVVKKAEQEADSISATKVSTFQMGYKDFLKELKLKEDPVIQSAILTGYPLINHVKYYEVLFNERI